MSMRLKADGTGTLAIYDTTSPSGEDAPFSDPMNNLSHLRFHSGLRMPRIISTTTYPVTLSTYYSLAMYRTTYTIAAHGRAGVPLIFGSIPSLGLSMMGTVWAVEPGPRRHLTLGADATNILLREEVHYATAGYAAPSFDLVVHICDYLLDGSAAPTDGTDAEAISMAPTVIKAQHGAWRSDNRYLRHAASGATMNVPRQATAIMSKSADSRGGYFPHTDADAGNAVAVKTQ